jgi:hypothetical protein
MMRTLSGRLRAYFNGGAGLRYQARARSVHSKNPTCLAQRGADCNQTMKPTRTLPRQGIFDSLLTSRANRYVRPAESAAEIGP